MSKDRSPKKVVKKKKKGTSTKRKVVPKSGVATKKKTIAPTVTRKKASETATSRVREPLVYKRMNFILMGVGFAVMVLGFLLMRGGGMEDPNVWDESQIYSFQRITLAPILILIGLGIELYAILKKF